MLWELRIKSFHSLFSIKTAYFACVCSQTQQKMHQKIHLFANISANSHFSHNKYTKKCILHFSLQEIFLKFFFITYFHNQSVNGNHIRLRRYPIQLQLIASRANGYQLGCLPKMLMSSLMLRKHTNKVGLTIIYAYI